jgi:FdhD protein
LAVGFLVSEGIIRRREDVVDIEPCGRNESGNLLNVRLAPEVPVDFAKLTRHVFASSSCGLCGKATIDAIRESFPPLDVADGLAIDAKALAGLADQMRQTQATFDRTGGLHAAGLFDIAAATLLHVREDVGRHNAVDKVVGRTLLDGRLAAGGFGLLVSGRASFEIMQKALAARLAIVAAVSAPSDLAAEFAEQSGQTLVGFLRGNRMNVYSHARRIRFPVE